MQLTFSDVLKRALLAGLAAGAITAVFLVIVVEPSISDAIAIEDAAAATVHPEHGAEIGHDEPMFTRAQQTIGGAIALVLFASLLSVVFATVYTSIRHRIPARSEFMRVIEIAAIGFATMALFPMLKYPANPPAVGNPDTVNERTIQYLSAVVFAVLCAVLIAHLSGALRNRFDDPTRIVITVATVVVVYGLGLVVLPGSPDSIDPMVPADLIWRFRLRSIGSLALVWTSFSLGFGWLLQRAMEPRTTAAPVGTAVAA